MAIGENLTNKEKQYVALGALAVALLGAYWYFLYKPRAAELTVMAAHVDSLNKRNQEARADIAQGSLQKLRAQSAEYDQSLKVMRQLVPRSNEVPALLEDISTAARRVGLDLATVEPMPVLAGEQFDTYRYKLAVIGGYHPVGQFLSNVGSRP
jgi:type IV pilus assembly protein PilO